MGLRSTRKHLLNVLSEWWHILSLRQSLKRRHMPCFRLFFYISLKNDAFNFVLRDNLLDIWVCWTSFSSWPSKNFSSVCYCLNEEQYKSFTECFIRMLAYSLTYTNVKKKEQGLLSLFFRHLMKNDAFKVFLCETFVSLTISSKLASKTF